MNEILVEDDITNRPRGQNGLFISKNHENAKDTRSKMCANLNIVGECSSIGESSVSVRGVKLDKLIWGGN